MKLFYHNNKLFCMGLALMAALYLLAVRPYWKPTWDSAVYLSLAQSLLSGEGYSYMGSPHTKYPPLFPLLLTPVIAVFGLDYFFLRLLSAILAVGAIGQCYLLIKRCNNTSTLNEYFSLKFTSLAVMLLSGISYAMLYSTTNVLSDIPYAFFSLVTLLYIEKFVSERVSDFRHLLFNRSAWITITLITLSFFTRTAGLTLVLSAVTYTLIVMVRRSGVKNGGESRRPYLYKILFLVTLFTICSSAWALRNKAHTSQQPAALWEDVSYETELFLVNPGASVSERVDLGKMVKRIEQNFRYYEQLIGRMISGKQIESPVGVRLILAIIICGFLLNVFFNLTIIEVYLFYYSSIYLLWPSLQGERFVVPVLPLLFYFILSFVNQLLFLLAGVVSGRGRRALRMSGDPLWSPRSWPVYLTVGFLFVLNISATADLIKEERRVPYYQGPVSAYLDAIEWVRDETPEDSIVITDRAPWVYLLTGRRAYGFPWTGRREAVLDSIKKIGPPILLQFPGVTQKLTLTL